MPGHDYVFPRDHFAHPDFKVEWWYLNGFLETESGERYGYHITFFRRGLIPPAKDGEAVSRFLRGGLHFAHFALSDLDGQEFHFVQKFARGTFGQAGNGEPGEGRLAWIDDWQLRLRDDTGSFAFAAEVDGIELELELRPTKPPVIHGEDGVSQRSGEAGKATHYYAFPRMAGEGSITIDGKRQSAAATGWLDREWGSDQLGDSQVGWDWFSLQLDDGRELMVYQLRQADGAVDRYAAGALIGRDGKSTQLSPSDFELIPLRRWKSKRTGGEYPVAWHLKVPGESIDLEVEAAFDAQELALSPVAYWEGVVRAKGSHPGRGYLEMTGYSTPLTALQK